jgi:ribonuclease D
MPPRRVLRDDLLIELAKRKSSDPRRMANLRGMDQRNIKHQLDVIAEVIEKSKNDEMPEWPLRQKSYRIQPSPMLIQYLASALSCICRRKSIAASIVGTADDLKEFVSYRLSTNRNQNGTVPTLLQGWRAQIVGQVLDDLLSGKASLQIQNPASDMPLKILETK